jgi:hypothetical protein
MSQGLEMTSTRGLQKSYSHKSKAPVIIFTGAIESFPLLSVGNFNSIEQQTNGKGMNYLIFNW